DFDGTRNAIFAIERASRTKQFSEELQVIGEGDRFNWIGGLYYFRERGDDPSGSLVGGMDQGDIELPSIYDYPGSQVVTDVSGRNESMAAFFQGTYQFGESGFSLTVGARITKDKRRATIRNRAANAAGVYSCRFTRD